MFLEKLNIKLRLPPITQFKKNEFDLLNKYMKRVLLRINSAVKEKNYTKAWTIAIQNIQYSLAFRLSAFNYVMSGWYYNLPVSEVDRILHRSNKILRRFSSKLDYKRVYIEKSNGKWRPLGVPKPEWRVALHLINGFFQHIMKEHIPDNQHAYLPGKGVLTAWKKILSILPIYDYVYETDLSNFFPSVNIHMVKQIMEIRFNAPRKITDWLLDLCKATPRFTGEKKLDETKFELFTRFAKFKDFWTEAQIESFQRYKDRRNKPDVTIVHLRTLRCDPQPHWVVPLTKEYVERAYLFQEKAILHKGTILDWKNWGTVPGGFPQGMPLSPFLSLFVLTDYMEQGFGLTKWNKKPPTECVGYADDFIFFSWEEFEVHDIPSLGVVHAKEKCGWIKFKGTWTPKGLKFLGFRVFENGKFLAETRSGTLGPILDIFLKVYKDESLLGAIEELQEIETLNHLTRYVTTDFVIDKKGQVRKPSLSNYILKGQEVQSSSESAEMTWALEKSLGETATNELEMKRLQEKAEKLMDKKFSPPKDNSYDHLISIARRNIFGFVMSCMNLNDWTNDHSYEDKLKTVRNLIGQLHPKALLRRVPINTDSSWAVSYLVSSGLKAMRSKKKVRELHIAEGIRNKFQEIIRNGKVNEHQIRRLRIKLSKRHSELREKKFKSLSSEIVQSL
jgi:hypothetical protein